MSGRDRETSPVARTESTELLPLDDLFRLEAESQTQQLTSGLLALERTPADADSIAPLMRAAHSLKGAARVVGLEAIERIAHVMEEVFVACQAGAVTLDAARVDGLLQAVDMINHLATLQEGERTAWQDAHRLEIANLVVALQTAAEGGQAGIQAGIQARIQAQIQARAPASATPAAASAPPSSLLPSAASSISPLPSPPLPSLPARPMPEVAPVLHPVLHVAAGQLDQLLALASASRVAAHGMASQRQAWMRLRQQQRDLNRSLERLAGLLEPGTGSVAMTEVLQQARAQSRQLIEAGAESVEAFESQTHRQLTLSQDLLDAVLAMRLRPLREGLRGLPRLVRDLARTLGKEARLELRGEETLVDRDTLAQLESPLTHLLRNALDHGLEPAAMRLAAGKPREGCLRLSAGHRAGQLWLTLEDDGAGVDLERLRYTLVARGMKEAADAAALQPAELLDFLLQPGFSLRDSTTDISGRGVGLDAVATSIRQLKGSLQLSSTPGQGFAARITLPLSQSLLRAVIVEIAGEPYALPLGQVVRILQLAPQAVHCREHHASFLFEGQTVPLLSAARLLGFEEIQRQQPSRLPVVVIGDEPRRCGLLVEAIHADAVLVVQPLEHLFGALPHVAAAAVLEDGRPVLILEVADLLADGLHREGDALPLHLPSAATSSACNAAAKRVLVVDDSPMVRAMQQRLLQMRGYAVEVAADGAAGWRLACEGDFALVITDVDMPQLDGLNLTRQLKQHARLGTRPVLIVSSQDSPEDRAHGQAAGADGYLAKGNLRDESLLQAVEALIGPATAAASSVS